MSDFAFQSFCKKNFVPKKRRIRFWLTNFALCQILNRKLYKDSDFGWNCFRKSALEQKFEFKNLLFGSYHCVKILIFAVYWFFNKNNNLLPTHFEKYSLQGNFFWSLLQKKHLHLWKTAALEFKRSLTREEKNWTTCMLRTCDEEWKSKNYPWKTTCFASNSWVLFHDC